MSMQAELKGSGIYRFISHVNRLEQPACVITKDVPDLRGLQSLFAPVGTRVEDVTFKGVDKGLDGSLSLQDAFGDTGSGFRNPIIICTPNFAKAEATPSHSSSLHELNWPFPVAFLCSLHVLTDQLNKE